MLHYAVWWKFTNISGVLAASTIRAIFILRVKAANTSEIF
jgi:hypothetical protein